jgi:SAM-dependent methyltransferase
VREHTHVFSSKAADYVRYRPGYPEAVIRLLQQECLFSQESVIADVGSGTGLLSELFLKNGNHVYGVEPNRERREAGEEHLKNYPRFRSVAARAESTTLEDQQVDFVTAGQAFHWFDHQQTRIEFLRILKPQGWVVLVWNKRRKDSNPFHIAYEELLMAFGSDLKRVRHNHSEVMDFFSPVACKVEVFESHQLLDFDGLRGRFLSSSKSPAPGSDRFDLVLNQLRSIFGQYQVNGRIRLEYDTTVYYGRLLSRHYRTCTLGLI